MEIHMEKTEVMSTMSASARGLPHSQSTLLVFRRTRRTGQGKNRRSRRGMNSATVRRFGHEKTPGHGDAAGGSLLARAIGSRGPRKVARPFGVKERQSERRSRISDKEMRRVTRTRRDVAGLAG